MTPEIIKFLTDSLQAVMEIKANPDPAITAAWIGGVTLIMAAMITGFVKIWALQKDLQSRQDKLHAQQVVTHEVVNGRMEQMLEIAKKLALRVGIEEGIEEERGRERERDEARKKEGTEPNG